MNLLFLLARRSSLSLSSVPSILLRRISKMAPPPPSSTINPLDDFQLVMKGRANDVYDVAKYRSKSTGLEVVHADIEGPIVNGYIVLATRASDDDGLPHTLEHLIFMGSEDFPYKGVLDILANKCFASGTNAWTDVDHTAYTLTTAGSEGFCNLLPIYCDHIFHPILSDSAFVTEVHHITGEGTDAGVVYCELQAKENTAEEKLYHELSKTIYPPSSGYHWQTGGICKNLRESCNNEKVKEFHAKFYNPRNTCVIVCGKVKPENLFQALGPTINKLAAKGVAKEWEKPWLDDVPEIPSDVEKHVKFPSEDDDEESLVDIGFRGPSAINEVETCAAMRLLLEYLTDSSVASLQLAFVENDDPICSNVSYAEMENSRTTFYMEFEGVAPERMKDVVPKLKDTLKKEIKKFKMQRMTDIINKNYQEELSSMENSPHNSVAYAVIGDYLYGLGDQETFDRRINQAKNIKGFLDKPAEYWKDLLSKGILGQKWVSLYAHPSKDTAIAFTKEEEGRVNDRRCRFGEPGLEKLTYDLEEAIKTNSIPAPQSLMEKVCVPSASSIEFHSIKRYANPDWAAGMKCNFYLDDIKSNFVYVSVHMDTTSLTYEQRQYLPLFRELLVESPVLLDDGKTMSYEDVVAELNREFLSHDCSVGIDGGGRFKCGSFCHQFVLNCQMQLSKLQPGFDWIRKLLWKTQWDVDRAKVVASKMAGDIPNLKRKGNRMTYLMLMDLLYKGTSPVKTASLLRQHKFLKELSKNNGKLKNILESIREVLLNPGNMTVHIATSLDKLKEQVKKDGKFEDVNALFLSGFAFPSEKAGEKRLSNQPDSSWMKEPSLFKTKPELKILGNRTEDSSYMVKVAPGPIDMEDAELPILLTAMNYLTQTEGPFYSAIRGAGLAYGVFMDAKCNEGLVYFSLYRCTDVVAAFVVAREIVEQHLNDKEGEVWSDEFLTSAKSSLIFEYIEGEKTPLALSSTSLCSYYRNVPEGYTRGMISKILQVKLSDLRPVMEKYLQPLFFEDYACSVVAPQDKVVPAIEGFYKTINKKVEPVTSLTNSFLEKWDQED